jgi:hypothetical protein
MLIKLWSHRSAAGSILATSAISEAKVNKKQVQCKNLHRDEKCLSIFQSVSTVFPKSTVQIQIHYCSCKESQEQYLSYTL